MKNFRQIPEKIKLNHVRKSFEKAGLSKFLQYFQIVDATSFMIINRKCNFISLLQLVVDIQYSGQIQIITNEVPYSSIEISDSRLTSGNLILSSDQESLL